MKANVFVLLAAGLVSTAAFAQTTSTTTTNPTSTAVTAPATGASTASLPQAVTAAEPSKLGFKLYSRQFMGKADFDKGGAVPSTENYAHASYKLSDNLSVGLRQVFFYTYANKGVASRAMMGDTQLHVVNSKIATLPGDWTVSGAGRLYLPTGESSRFKFRRQGAVYGSGAVGKSFGRTDLSWTLVGMYYNSPDSYVDAGKTKANRLVDFGQYADAAYNLSDSLSISQTIGTETTFFRSVPNEGPKAENLYLSTGFTYSAMKALSLTAFVENTPNILNSKKAFQLYDSEDVTYNMAVTLSM